jgi:hypothetical protein
MRRYGAAASAVAGVSPVHQFAQAWWLRVWYGIEPSLYYALRLYDPERWPRAHGVVRGREMTRLVAASRAGSPAGLFRDKVAFAAWADACCVPMPETVLAVDAATHADAVDLPDVDLFTKLSATWGGRGARRWRRVGTGRWAPSEGVGGDVPAVVDTAGFVSALRHQAAAEGCMVFVQRALATHPAVTGLTNGAVGTARIITLRDPGGAASLCLAVYRMPAGRAVIDAISHGGLAAPVDVATGRLGRATTQALAPTGRTVERHPDTGMPIAGVTLPDWPAVVALVLRAHSALPGVAPVVGWDVALTPDGPVVLEGNATPGAALAQVPAGIPLGETPLVACLLSYLRVVDRTNRQLP